MRVADWCGKRPLSTNAGQLRMTVGGEFGPLTKDLARPVVLAHQYRECTLAVDASAWLHRFAYPPSQSSTMPPRPCLSIAGSKCHLPMRRNL